MNTPLCPECQSATDVLTVEGGFICQYPDCKGEVFVGNPRPIIPESSPQTVATSREQLIDCSREMYAGIMSKGQHGARPASPCNFYDEVAHGAAEDCKPRPTIPDSGSRTEFATGAIRDAMTGKGQPSRIPPAFIRSVARRFEDGAEKYPDINGKPNWMHGIPLSRYLDAITRHSLQMAEGDETEDHVGAVGWNAAGFQWTLEQIQSGKLPAELDDRPFKPFK